ncbi:hypothetical protein EV645_7794 [Kribbella rubisoli]|uniref:Uncharacterized protein n=1 Tax=Kribbella rubisoli TaxID=3075929 RepID=A0A4Q7VYK7_9ACTN|nr:hypothetical protein EV645_7794 [Kribbella rubisoli]
MSAEKDEGKRSPKRIRLPGFIVTEETGLGDAIGRATSYVGIKQCGGCARRAAKANQWVRLYSR